MFGSSTVTSKAGGGAENCGRSPKSLSCLPLSPAGSNTRADQLSMENRELGITPLKLQKRPRLTSVNQVNNTFLQETAKSDDRQSLSLEEDE